MKTIDLIDPNGRISIMYSIKEDKSMKINTYRIEKLHSQNEVLGERTKRKFLISDEDKEIIVLSIMKEQVFVNIATIVDDIFKLASVSTKISFIETEKQETLELYYTPTAQRKIFIIDLETGDEVEPEISLTSEGLMKGIINLEIGKKYLTIELRNDTERLIAVGMSQLLLEDDLLKLNIKKEEVKRINLEKYIELISSGKAIEKKLDIPVAEKER